MIRVSYMNESTDLSCEREDLISWVNSHREEFESNLYAYSFSEEDKDITREIVNLIHPPLKAQLFSQWYEIEFEKEFTVKGFIFTWTKDEEGLYFELIHYGIHKYRSIPELEYIILHLKWSKYQEAEDYGYGEENYSLVEDVERLGALSSHGPLTSEFNPLKRLRETLNSRSTSQLRNLEKLIPQLKDLTLIERLTMGTHVMTIIASREAEAESYMDFDDL